MYALLLPSEHHAPPSYAPHAAHWLAALVGGLHRSGGTQPLYALVQRVTALEPSFPLRHLPDSTPKAMAPTRCQRWTHHSSLHSSAQSHHGSARASRRQLLNPAAKLDSTPLGPACFHSEPACQRETRTLGLRGRSLSLRPHPSPDRTWTRHTGARHCGPHPDFDRVLEPLASHLCLVSVATRATWSAP